MNIGDLYAETLAAASTAADLILVSPARYTGFTPDDGVNLRTMTGFQFQIISDESLSLQSDITDHLVEDNTNIQDHVALKPVHFTVSGYIGELNNVVPDSKQLEKAVVDRLGTLSAYIPSVTNTAQRLFNSAMQIYQLRDKIINASKVAAGLTVNTKQLDAFNKLYTYWQNRTLFWVATPFGQFDNMMIESLTATQPENSKSISDFTITFKRVKFAATKIVVSNRISDVSTPTNKGTQAGATA